MKDARATARVWPGLNLLFPGGTKGERIAKGSIFVVCSHKRWWVCGVCHTRVFSQVGLDHQFAAWSLRVLCQNGNRVVRGILRRIPARALDPGNSPPYRRPQELLGARIGLTRTIAILRSMQKCRVGVNLQERILWLVTM
jgi:hypothetical protein